MDGGLWHCTGDRDQDHPQDKEMQKSKMAVWGDLTNSCERREVKGNGEKERHTHLNAEFQRIARRDKKAFLSDQSKEIEKNNRMGKTRDLFKKIRDTKGTFHAKIGSKKEQKWCGPNRSRRGGKNTQKNYTKKIFTTRATGLEKVTFYSNPKERQCQRMLKLSHNCTHLTRY